MRNPIYVKAIPSESFENLPKITPRLSTRYERWKQMSTIYSFYRFFKVGLASEAELERMADEPEGVY